MTPLKIAHRGASGHAPENTLPAFDKALELGVDMIECDVRLCKSGSLVVIHDKTVDRTTNGSGKVSTLTITELKKLDAGHGARIPTLTEVLERYQDQVKIMIDIKSAAAAEEFVKLIEEHQAHEQIIAASINHALLTDIKLRDPRITTCIIFDIYNYFKYFFVKNLFVFSAKLINANQVNIYYRFSNQRLVRRAHKYKLKFNVYSPHKKEDIEMFIKMGVDGIITDYPDRI